ncbi:MAG: hypothetical protein ACI849_000723 [Patiriisocius sp.]
MNYSFPFDPRVKHHILLAIGLAIWIFCFLNFTEPLDINDFTKTEKWMHLPFYGFAGAATYLLILPLQYKIYNFNKKWTLLHELLFLLCIVIIGFVFARGVYLYIIVPDEPYPYTLGFFIVDLYIPALTTIAPIIFFGRWAFGKYEEKKVANQKIEIQGEGAYEGLKLLFNDIVCIKADDNYIEVHYLDIKVLKKQLIRNKLSVIEKEFPELLRTHRSYLVNPFHFKAWKTGQGKLNIILSSEIEIPVSKTQTDNVKQVLQ